MADIHIVARLGKLNSVFQRDDNGNINQYHLNLIEERVRVGSMAGYIGSLKAIACVLHAYDNHMDTFPALKEGKYAAKIIGQCFRVHMEYPDQIPAPIQDMFLPMTNLVVDSQGNTPEGVSYMYEALADTYATSCCNHLIANWSKFIDYAIEAHSNGNGIDYKKDDKVDMIRLQIYNGINENNGNDGLSEVDKMFVRFFRNFFSRRGLGSISLSDQTVKDNIDLMPLFFAHILRFQDYAQNTYKIDVRRFHVLPKNHLGRRCIDYGGKELHWDITHMPEEEGGKAAKDKCARDKFKGDIRVKEWEDRFKVDKYKGTNGQNRTINDGRAIKTDGYRASVLLKVPAQIDENDNRDGDGEASKTVDHSELGRGYSEFHFVIYILNKLH